MVITGLSKFIKTPPAKLIGKKVGLVCHAASVMSDFTHSIEAISSTSVIIGAIFGPQHGLFGQTQDNMIEWDGSEKESNSNSVPLYSLYGENRKPTPAMMQNLDAIVIDLQDVGARPYTYIWTLKHCMEACIESNIPLYVLDRPNPVAHLGVDGAILASDHFTFVGGAEIPLAHSMTMGEMALWIKKVYYPNAELEILGMDGWSRDMSYRDTKLPWVLPSPNMPTIETAIVYPGMVLFETVNVSEGRGSVIPFELFGAPFIDKTLFRDSMKKHTLDGLILREHDFIPTFNKHSDSYCSGFQIHITDMNTFKPVKMASALMQASYDSSNGAFSFTEPPYEYEFDKPPVDIVSGDSSLREWVTSGESIGELEKVWQKKYGEFNEIFESVKLY